MLIRYVILTFRNTELFTRVLKRYLFNQNSWKTQDTPIEK